MSETRTEEAVAWMVVDKDDRRNSDEIFTDEGDARDALRLANRDAYLLAPWRIVPLYEHPTPAPEVTVTEAMVERVARADFSARHGESCWDSPNFAREREWTIKHVRNLLTTAVLRGVPHE